MIHKYFHRAAVLLVVVAGTSSAVISQSTDSLLSKAWLSWRENNHTVIKSNFLDVLKQDPSNARAQIGLSFLYDLVGKHNEAFRCYQKALDQLKDPYPYVYAAWAQGKFTGSGEETVEGITPFFEKLSKSGDSTGIVSAYADERLADTYQDNGDLAAADKIRNAVGAISDFTLIGPFENISESGFDKSFPPDHEYDTSKTYPGKDEIPVHWFKRGVIGRSIWIDFQKYFAYTNAMYYANTFVYAPARMDVQIRVGTSGSLKTYLNDALIAEDRDEKNDNADTYVVATELQQGWNRILIKCGYSENNRCNFALRITNPSGSPVQGLQVSSDPKMYTPQPNVPHKTNENFAEAFFKQKIADEPDHYENYLLLADSYLNNDKTIEAELVLRKLIGLLPGSVLPLYHLSESYQRGRRGDDQINTDEKIYSLDKYIPSILGNKILKSIEREEYTSADEYMHTLDSLAPQSLGAISTHLGYYTKKKQMDKLVEISHAAYQKFPDNIGLAYIEAQIQSQSTQKYDRSIEVMKTFLEHHLNIQALQYLSSYYFYALQTMKGFDTFKKILELDPDSPGYNKSLSSMYTKLQDYPNAEHYIRQAIAICPNSSQYWEMLGDALRGEKKNDDARQSYMRALQFNASNYSARDQLRDLDGKKSIFLDFSRENTDSLMQNSPAAVSYPNAGAVYLLHDLQRVVYDQGASEALSEEIIKVLNTDGIDNFKEYRLPYNEHNQSLIVDLAEVRKQDGSTVKADVSDDDIVFKSLEVNDIIHLKWRVRNYYHGKLKNKFWETAYLNGFYPVMNGQYSLLVPKKSPFHYKTQLFSGDPAITELDDGTLYKWSLHNEPAVRYEAGMSASDDASKEVTISSIEQWSELVDWYSEVAYPKSRSTYEIQEQVKKILSRPGLLTQHDTLRAIFDFIVENIRYSEVSFRQSAYIPQKARDVLSTRLGDCKDNATLCIAMLREAHIPAYFVLVNTKDQGLNKTVLPSIAFNHCIVAAETKNGLQYIDLTAANFPYGSVPEMDLHAFSLLIKPGVTEPEYIPDVNSLPRSMNRTSSATIRADLGLHFTTRAIRTGELTAGIRGEDRNKNEAERKKSLGEELSTDFPGSTVISYFVKDADSLNPSLENSFEFDDPQYASESGRYILFKIPWRNTMTVGTPVSYESRMYPLYFWRAVDTMKETIQVAIPDGYTIEDLNPGITLTTPFGKYESHYTFSKKVLRANTILICSSDVASPAEYLQFKKFYSDIAKDQQKQVFMKKKK